MVLILLVLATLNPPFQTTLPLIDVISRFFQYFLDHSFSIASFLSICCRFSGFDSQIPFSGHTSRLSHLFPRPVIDMGTSLLYPSLMNSPKRLPEYPLTANQTFSLAFFTGNSNPPNPKAQLLFLHQICSISISYFRKWYQCTTQFQPEIQVSSLTCPSLTHFTPTSLLIVSILYLKYALNPCISQCHHSHPDSHHLSLLDCQNSLLSSLLVFTHPRVHPPIHFICWQYL